MDWSVKNKDIPELFQMWGDLFAFQKKYYKTPGANATEVAMAEFWKKVINESDQILRKYNSDQCNGIMNTIIEDFGRQIKEG